MWYEGEVDKWPGFCDIELDIFTRLGEVGGHGIERGGIVTNRLA